jgi:hypothetical protein
MVSASSAFHSQGCIAGWLPHRKRTISMIDGFGCTLEFLADLVGILVNDRTILHGIYSMFSTRNQ